ncbi:MAG: isocitrate/isopropylmalate family dehydrogenase [Patescibacteria group bacterium]|nr:isocitrate/isopropylmalate family dehydrogenase [Patescibacteria group bacterium]
MNRTVKVALVRGDGAAPEMMAAAVEIAIDAAKLDAVDLRFTDTPMGWNAYDAYGDTFPSSSLAEATEAGLLFFGGVGDPQFDSTIGVQKPNMRPETRVLMGIRKQWQLLMNFRPMIYHPALSHLANVKADKIPACGIEQHFVRFLLEDSYFGTSDLRGNIGTVASGQLGLKCKAEVTGLEEIVSELAYYRRETLVKYFRAAFAYARAKGLPVISIDKANIMARYKFWRDVVTAIGRSEFPDVELRHQLVDSANSLLFTPAALHGVIVCGNEHGDILSDGAAAALGSMGMMCSSAVNPDNGMAMFESGAGTVPTLAGQNKANPLGRILTAAMMLQHIGANIGAAAIERGVRTALLDGFRTVDLASLTDRPDMILGTQEMAEEIGRRL